MAIKPLPSNDQIMLAQVRDQKGLIQETSSANKQVAHYGMGNCCPSSSIIPFGTY
ncbi:uncharacterized protein ASPGLDRAFT_573527 [Aspergillus glaucus CBS 516.65]|uniref:Uncharacterized protein n=1 Tax=Aspergillus glaucus CBS 516.65 TaxID=1160497 RepID=A0A1L9VE08_ASPGL|nr:hypothetical protein ASPGLDRAFT_573527 [Aspergillus glaucus CBS 516.65]OJJ82136.1 hypothetical protein ASPGLDRAFT_573527 [Aspergillus glaucus CBS 516.65]